MPDSPLYRIFLSSPGDVSEERAFARLVLRRLEREFASSARLEVVDWEHEPIFGHASFQDQIERPSRCDLVISIIWSRLGTRLPADYAPADGKAIPTGTEFEINDALSAFRAMGKPNLLIYRKIPGPQVTLGSANQRDRETQFEMLDDFCRHAFYDERGAIIVAHHTFGDASEFEHRLAVHVREWLGRQIAASTPDNLPPPWTDGSPFPGLEPFSARHQAVFFGRSQAISALTKIIRTVEDERRDVKGPRMLLVHGMSGAGKTSLFNAGLLPFLELRPVEAVARWIIVSLNPSRTHPQLNQAGPLGVLAALICEQLPSGVRLATSPEKLAEGFLSNPEATAERIEDALATIAGNDGVKPGRIRVLVYIDQLEEMFSDPATSGLVDGLISAMVALARSGSIWITATMRSDFLHRLQDWPALLDCLGPGCTYTMMPPRPDELLDIIREPARAAGLVWEEKDGTSLDRELLREAASSPESLPLLEYTLAEIFRASNERVLRWKAYQGGLRGALISAASDAMPEGDANPAFRAVMRELVGISDDGVATRRYASLGRFHEGEARRLLDNLVKRRLCVTMDDFRGDGPMVTLAHEALISSWPLAQKWLEAEKTLLRKRDEVVHDARLWVTHDRAAAWLGAEPEKLAAIRDVRSAGLIPAGEAEDYARLSRIRSDGMRLVRRGTVAAICMLALLAAFAWRKAGAERDAAVVALNTARETSSFLASLFKDTDPAIHQGVMLTAGQILERGRDRVRNAPIDRANVRADVLTAIGQAYAGLGNYNEADSLMQDAMRAQKAALDAEPDSVQIDSRIQTLTTSGFVSYRLGRYSEAATTLREATNLARRHLPISSMLRAQALVFLSESLVDLETDDALDEAVSAGNEGLTSARAITPVTKESETILAHAYATLGTAYDYQGDAGKAQLNLGMAMEIGKRVLGDHPVTAESMANLGFSLYENGQYDEALRVTEEALPIFRKLYAPDHPELTSVLNNLARMSLVAGRIDAAEPMFEEILAATERSLGAKHDELIPPLNSLAMIDAQKMRLDASRKKLRRAEAIAIDSGQSDILDQVLLNRASVELQSGNTAAGSAFLERALEQLKRNHPDRVMDEWRYAMWDLIDSDRLLAMGRIAEAREKVLPAQASIRARFGGSSLFDSYAALRLRRLDEMQAVSQK